MRIKIIKSHEISAKENHYALRSSRMSSGICDTFPPPPPVLLFGVLFAFIVNSFTASLPDQMKDRMNKKRQLMFFRLMY